MTKRQSPRTLTAKQVRSMLDEQNVYADELYKTKGQFVFKKFYFYAHGQTARKWADKIAAALPDANIVIEEDKWNVWPKDSWFEVRFTMGNA